MKLMLKMLALLLIVINISLPDTFRDIGFYSPDTLKTLSDFDPDSDRDDVANEDDKTEIEHLETELYLQNGNISFFISSLPFRINIPLHTFISSFLPSIYIPPLF